jgi:hypothetical protein
MTRHWHEMSLVYSCTEPLRHGTKSRIPRRDTLTVSAPLRGCVAAAGTSGLVWRSADRPPLRQSREWGVSGQWAIAAADCAGSTATANACAHRTELGGLLRL